MWVIEFWPRPREWGWALALAWASATQAHVPTEQAPTLAPHAAPAAAVASAASEAHRSSPTLHAIVPRTDSPDLRLPDGGNYFGPVRNGLMQGQGRIEWGPHRWYTGELHAGRMHGQGVLHTPEGRVQGEFRDGMPHGHGIEETVDGRRYEGQFSQGRHDGQGVLTDPDGIRYEGAFVQGRFTGQGRVTSADGEVMEGQFVAGQPHGLMVMRHPNGTQVTSEMRDGMPHGVGELRLPNGQRIRGDLGQGLPHGEITYPNGDRYVGELRRSQPHGMGELRLANGDVHRGAFHHGKPHGAGEWVPRSGGPAAAERGVWAMGVRTQGRDGGAEPPVVEVSPADNNQMALYAQGALLAKQLDALQPNDPRATEMYALFVAGDGTQEVFRREVEWIAQDFAQRLGTQGRSVVLANSRTSVARLPLATPHSIAQSLQALAQRMDPAQDLLLVYLTSHGSRDHQLAIGMTDMALPQLSATRLAELLKASGIRHQVVVVSACYSGGFIEPLRAPTTWVLTAARHDRTSFGCADENDFTYFGRALFKESLPKARTLSEAFAQAKALVVQWERELGQELGKAASGAGDPSDAVLLHSEPQMAVTPEFQAWVDRWFAQQRQVLPHPTPQSLSAQPSKGP